MALEIVQELFYSVAYEDSSGKVALKRFKIKENAVKYAALHQEHTFLCKTIRSMSDRVTGLESEMSDIEPSDRFSDARVDNIIEGDVQCFNR
jgi:hypothetical protein